MKFDISGITHVGSVRESNQDRILVNGTLLSEGEVELTGQDSVHCFVADGVGGNQAGAFASNYVLEKIGLIPDFSHENYIAYLSRINEDLLSICNERVDLVGAATTLTGLLVDATGFEVIHCGDSQLWLFRNEMLFKVTTDHVLDEFERNSPITSFLGGRNNNLRFDSNIFVDDLAIGDVVLLCSDGLFKSLDKKSAKSIIERKSRTPNKVKELLETSLLNGAEDNVSVILIERTE